MPQYQTWEEFSRAAEKLYLADPMKVNPRGAAASAPGQDVFPAVRAASGASPAPAGGAGRERRRTPPGVLVPVASRGAAGRGPETGSSQGPKRPCPAFPAPSPELPGCRGWFTCH